MKPWEKYQDGPWAKYQASDQHLAAAGAAGASRGILNTLDILPRGIAGGYNVLAGPIGLPKLDVSPARRLGATAGIGTRQPTTPGERRASFAGEVLGASALPAVGAVSRAARPLQTLLTESSAAGGAAAGGIAGGEIAGPTGEALGTLAGGFAPLAAPLAARGIVAPRGQAQIPGRVAAAQRQNVPITAGQAAGGSFLEKASATFPGGQRIAAEFAEKQALEMGRRTSEIARGMTAMEPSSEAAGRAIKQGIDQFATNFKRIGGELYEHSARYLPRDAIIPIANTKRALKAVVSDEAVSDIVDSPLVRRLHERLEDWSTVPIEWVSQLRTSIGGRLTSPSLLVDTPRGQLKRLYGALSDDLYEAAREAGPEAEQAFALANNYWRAGHKRIDDFLDPIQKRNIPEKVFRAAIQGTDDGASRVRALKKSIEPEQWNVVVATMIRRLGKTRPSERTTGGIIDEATDFSPETFATNLERLDVKARQALFSGSRYAYLERNLKDLQEIAQGIRGQRQRAFNPSGTAAASYNTLGLGAPLVGALYSPGIAAPILGALGANMALQRMLQQPGVVSALGNPRMMTPAGLPQLTRMGQVLGGQPNSQ